MRYLIIFYLLTVTGCAKQYSDTQCLEMQPRVDTVQKVLWFNTHCKAHKMVGKRNVHYIKVKQVGGKSSTYRVSW
jgi:hypothetical protein